MTEQLPEIPTAEMIPDPEPAKGSRYRYPPEVEIALSTKILAVFGNVGDFIFEVIKRAVLIAGIHLAALTAQSEIALVFVSVLFGLLAIWIQVRNTGYVYDVLGWVFKRRPEWVNRWQIGGFIIAFAATASLILVMKQIDRALVPQAAVSLRNSVININEWQKACHDAQKAKGPLKPGADDPCIIRFYKRPAENGSTLHYEMLDPSRK